LARHIGVQSLSVAPEILLSQDSVTQKCDIWYIHPIRSVGSTILELVTGQPPYFKLDQYPAMYKIANMNEEIALPENISANLKDFLSKCFIKEPSHRASAAQLLSHPWLAQISNVAEIRV
jgi:serine/threonine protein kinase